MDVLQETGTATAAASVLVNLCKLALPAAPGWLLVVIALGAGLLTTFLVSIANGSALTSAEIAANVLQGIFAAAAAGGLDRVSAAAQAARTTATAEPGTVAARGRV